ncbi:MAG TPA: ABC transporter ATP-binding protein [Flavobacteriales bacterium]|nr:ABC transporter ATP-binding protein [Flavobacteriales bacterium]
MNCIETIDLTHTFSSGEKVLKGINIQVPQASIYGFLGPNGAGKTTTLRLILGLLKKQQGQIHLFGKTIDANRVEILKNTGSLIESPSLYGHLTASENLKIHQRIHQCPAKRIDEVLEIVGLSKTGKKKAGRFSLGMKQRLSIAMALLHTPSLLILDEPTNGLDPNGILEMRELLKKLNAQEKITVLVSSHLLAEVEKLVSHLGIIHKGSILFQGTLDDLHKKQNQSSVVRFATSNIEKTAEIVRAQQLNPALSVDAVSIPVVEKEKVSAINAALVNNGIQVYEITIVKNDLETIFMDLTNNSNL